MPACTKLSTRNWIRFRTNSRVFRFLRGIKKRDRKLRGEFRRRNYDDRLPVDCLMIFKAVVVRTTGVFLYRSYSHRHVRAPAIHDTMAESREAMRYFASSCNPRPWVTLTTKNKRAEKPQTVSIKISLSLSLSHDRPRHSVVFRNLRSYMRGTKANISVAPVVTASRVSH